MVIHPYVSLISTGKFLFLHHPILFSILFLSSSAFHLALHASCPFFLYSPTQPLVQLIWLYVCASEISFCMSVWLVAGKTNHSYPLDSVAVMVRIGHIQTPHENSYKYISMHFNKCCVVFICTTLLSESLIPHFLLMMCMSIGVCPHLACHWYLLFLSD